MFGKNWRAQEKAGGHETCFGLTKPIVPDWLAGIDQATTSRTLPQLPEPVAGRRSAVLNSKVVSIENL